MAALTLAACTTFGTLEPRDVTPIAVSGSKAAQLVSRYRVDNGLGPVRPDPRLRAVARDYARAMGERDRIKHGIGAPLSRRATQAGYQWAYIAENLGAGYKDLNHAIAGWKASAGHRKILLNPRATEIGIAAVSTPEGSRFRTYWVMVLGSPAPQRVAASGPGVYRQ